MEGKRDLLIRSAIRGVRLYGLDGVRIQHIGKLAGVAPGGIYAHFSGKEELLQAGFEQVDRQIADLFLDLRLDPARLVADPAGEVRRLWTPYFRWLVAHPDETVFYHRFRDSPTFPAFNAQRDVSYFAPFLQSVQLFQEHYHVFDRFPPDLVWLHLLTSTVLYAKYVVEGVLPDAPSTEEGVFLVVMYGLGGLIAPPGSEAPAL